MITLPFSTSSKLNVLALSFKKSSFRAAFPCTNWIDSMSSESSFKLSTHFSIRLKIPFDVAWVGKPKKRPLLPVLVANCSAVINEASVFPNPIGASRTTIPGLDIWVITWDKIDWTLLGSNPNLSL